MYWWPLLEKIYSTRYMRNLCSDDIEKVLTHSPRSVGEGLPGTVLFYSLKYILFSCFFHIIAVLWKAFFFWGICVLTPTFKCNCALIFLTLWFFPLIFTSQRDFTPSQRLEQGQIRKNQGRNRNELWKIKDKITKLKKWGQNYNCTSKQARTPKNLLFLGKTEVL